MPLSFGLSLWILILLVLVALVASWWSYRDTVPETSLGKKIFLGSMRFFALALTLFLLFEPLWKSESIQETKPVVSILIDNSESMALADSLLGNEGMGLNELFDIVQRASSSLDVRLFSFGSTLESADSLKNLSFDESRTDLAAALTQAARNLGETQHRAAILVSDGLYNAGTNPIHTSESYPVPILTLAYGDSTARQDVRIVQVVTNQIAYSGSTLPVLVRIRNEGFESNRVMVSLSSGNQTVDQQSVMLPEAGAETEIELAVDANEPGRLNLRVDVSRLNGETTYRNNSQSVVVQVLDQKKNILLVAGAPSPDVSALTRILKDDDTATINRFVQAPNGSFYEGDLPDDLSEVDLMVLIGFPSSATPAALSRKLADLAGSGTPVFLIHDRSTQLQMLRQDWSSVLPIQPDVIRPNFVAGRFRLTTAASSHVVFDMGERRDNASWTRLPPLSLGESRWTLAPGATVLATGEMRGIALDDPVFVVGRQGLGRKAVLLAHGFWKWTNVPDDLKADAERFDIILENTIQWLFATEDDRLVRVSPSEDEYGEGESVILRGEVYDEALRPLSDASLSVLVTTDSGQVFPYEMAPVGSGRYSIDVGNLPAGAYSYSAKAERNGTELGEDSGAFSIGRRTLEFKNTKADFALMNQIAERSGGRSLSQTDLQNLPSVLASVPGFKPVQESIVQQIRLWQRFPFLFLILTLLTVEWFFRKRFGMV